MAMPGSTHNFFFVRRNKKNMGDMSKMCSRNARLLVMSDIDLYCFALMCLSRHLALTQYFMFALENNNMFTFV